MKKIKIAQIGTSENSHGNSIWQRLTRLSDIFEIVGYAFPENEREKFPKQAAAFDGYREMSVGSHRRDRGNLPHKIRDYGGKGGQAHSYGKARWS